MNGRSSTWLWGAAGAAAAVLGARAVWNAVRPMLDLRGRTVLITGGSRGLGLVMAREFARQGARMAICARNQLELDRARRDLLSRGAQVWTTACDITDQTQVETMVREIEHRWGPIDILINNAGVIEVGPLDVMTLEDYEETMRTHFWAPLYATLAVLPGMRRRRRGRIVNISSIGGKLSVPHLLPYSASKFALTGLSEGLRAELAREGILVTTVCPGLMRTGSTRNATFKGRHRAESSWFELSAATPLSSMSAERAARRIVLATQRGEAEVVLSIQAKLAVLFHGLFPGTTANLLGLVNRVLPEPGGIGRARATGAQSRPNLLPAWLTALLDRAARANNEVL